MLTFAGKVRFMAFAGVAHKLVSLKELVDEIQELYVPLTKQVKSRFDECSELVEEANELATQWDDTTQSGVQFIHQVRDNQVRNRVVQ